MQRRLIKALEDLCVQYDGMLCQMMYIDARQCVTHSLLVVMSGTVRSSDKTVVQFTYGDDGLVCYEPLSNLFFPRQIIAGLTVLCYVLQDPFNMADGVKPVSLPHVWDHSRAVVSERMQTRAAQGHAVNQTDDRQLDSKEVMQLAHEGE